MGLLDFFKKSNTDSTTGQTDKALTRLARTAANKHAQNFDRMEALHALAELQTDQACSALLKRFTFYIEPHITDQEEKEVAFRAVVSAGKTALQPIRDFCKRAESLAWALKALTEILPEDDYVAELIGLLSAFDTEYTKNSEPKIQLISALEGKRLPGVREAVLPFVEDVNEPVRFHAITTLFSLNDDATLSDVCPLLPDEESVRVRNRVFEEIRSRKWKIPAELLDSVSSSLTPSYILDGNQILRGR